MLADKHFLRDLYYKDGFHTAMAYLACIGKLFADAGLQDVVIESEVVAAGSIDGVISGHHYHSSYAKEQRLYSEFLTDDFPSFLLSPTVMKGGS